MRHSTPHFVAIPRSDGTHRHRWQPAPALRAAGWKPVRLSDARGEAITQADWINAAAAAWKRGDTDGLRMILDTWAQDAPLPELGLAACPCVALAVPGAAGAAAGGPKSVAAMIDGYKASTRFTRLAAATRRDYANHLERWRAFMGDVPAAAVTPRMIDQRYEALMARGRHHYANAHMRVISIVFTWGLRNGFNIRRDPTKKIGMETAPTRLRLITFAEEDAILAAARALGRLDVAAAFIAAQYHGQRKGDVLAGPVAHWQDGKMLWVQSKTGVPVSIPVIPPMSAVIAAHRADVEARFGGRAGLAARLEAAMRGDTRQRWSHLLGPTLIVNQDTGLPFDPIADDWRGPWDEIRARAARAVPSIAGKGPDAPRPKVRDPRTGRLEDGPALGVRFMDTRDTAVTRLWSAPNVNAAWIAAVTGHSLAQIAAIMKHYLIVDGTMAAHAMEALERAAPVLRAAEKKAGKG